MRHLLLVVVVSVCSAALAGCTTMLKQGGDPVPYSKTGLSEIPPPEDFEWALRQARQLAPGETSPMALNFEDGLGYAALEAITLGFYPKRCTQLTIGSNELGQPTVTAVTVRFRPLFLWYDATVTKFRADGKAVGRYKSWVALPVWLVIPSELGLVFRRDKECTATDDRGLMPLGGKRITQYRGDVEEATVARYDRKDAWIVLLGLFGMGTSNGKRYVQFLWIPIPAGSVN